MNRSYNRDSFSSRAEIIEIDLNTLTPHINGPFTPDLATPVDEMKNKAKAEGWPTEIKWGLIGSCTNSSYEDLSRAASIARQALKKNIKTKSQLGINPGSEQVRYTAERDGIIEVFEKLESKIFTNACGPCIGQWYRPGENNTKKNSIIHSFNRNFSKRNDGNPNTHAFVTSPEMVMAVALSGNLDFNPLTDKLTSEDGQQVFLDPPIGDELPSNGFAYEDNGYVEPPLDGSNIEININPESKRLQVLEPFSPWNGENINNARLLIKAHGKCTTDHISMAGPWLRFRGHLDNISDNCLIGAVNHFNMETNSVKNLITGEYGPVPETQRFYKKNQVATIVVGDHNYGEGSSREHAAMEPRHLGIKAVIVKSFARIHETNLKKQGMLAFTFDQEDDYNKILEYGEEVLSISQAHGDIEKEIIATSNLGIYYATNLDYKSAIEYFYSSLEKSKTIQFDRQTAQNLINLGTIYARLFNPKESLSNYQAVVEKYDQVLVDTTKTIIFNNIGNIHFEEKSYKESKKHFQKSLALAEKIQYTEMIALALAHLGKLSCAENDFETAMSFSDRANELLEDLGDVNAKSINVLNFAKLAHHSGDFEIAILHLKEGVEISKKVRNEENEIACYRLLAEFYKDKKDFENAFQFKSLYAEKQEDYLKKQRNRQILDQEITFATREKEQQIEALTQANQLQAMLLKKQEEVERANEQLTQVNEELKQFAYVASHDLKEPLRMIGSYTQIINRKYASDIDDNTQAYFHYVIDGVERMNNLLDGLLKYATVGRGAQELKVINLNDTLLICQANLRLLIEETNTKLEVDELPSILGISSLISQLFQNLILNAIKFRNKDTFPEISIKSEEREKEYLIAIKDNGIGIKEEYKERIFVIFQRLHAQTDYEGTGIGLAICHKIMQRMGGKIWVDSEYGNGSTFFFTFPKPMGISNKVIES